MVCSSVYLLTKHEYWWYKALKIKNPPLVTRKAITSVLIMQHLFSKKWTKDQFLSWPLSGSSDQLDLFARQTFLSYWIFILKENSSPLPRAWTLGFSQASGSTGSSGLSCEGSSLYPALWHDFTHRLLFLPAQPPSPSSSAVRKRLPHQVTLWAVMRWRSDEIFTVKPPGLKYVCSMINSCNYSRPFLG